MKGLDRHDGRPFHTPKTAWVFLDETVLVIGEDKVARRAVPKDSGRERKRLKKQQAKGNKG
jgi:hypothetical protein